MRYLMSLWLEGIVLEVKSRSSASKVGSGHSIASRAVSLKTTVPAVGLAIVLSFIYSIPSGAQDSALYKKYEQELNAAVKAHDNDSITALEEKMVAEAEKFGSRDPRLLHCIGQLGRRYVSLGRLLQAELILRRAPGIRQNFASARSDDLAVADLEVLLAHVCGAQGSHGAGLQFAQAALETQLTRLSATDPALLPTEMILFDLYSTRQAYDKAETAGRRILTILANDKRSSPASLELWTAKQADLLDSEKKTTESQKLLSHLKSQPAHGQLLSQQERDLRTSAALVLGSIDARHSRYSQAKRWYRRALAMQTGKKSPLQVTCYQALAQMELSRGNFTSAEKNYMQALSLADQSQPIEGALVFKQLAQMYIARGTIGRAITAYNKALVLYEKATGVESTVTISTMQELNDLCKRFESYADADVGFDRMQRARAKWALAENKNSGESLLAIATHNLQIGRLEKAESQLKHVLKLMAIFAGKESPAYASTLDELGQCYFARGKPLDARRIYEDLLPIYKKLYGADSSQVAASLIQIGRGSSILGDRKRGEDNIKQAIAIAERIPGCETEMRARFLVELADCYLSYRDFRKAGDALTAAININEKTLASLRNKEIGGQNDVKHAGSFLSLCSLYTETGETAKAARCMQEAQQLIAKAGLSDRSGIQARIWFMRADTDGRRKHYAQSEQNCSQGMKVLEKGFGQRGFPVATATLHSMLLYGRAGKCNLAEASGKHAIDILNKLHLDDGLSAAELWQDLGETNLVCGNLQKARECHLKALALRKSLLQASSPLLADSQYGLGVTLLQEKKYAEAEALFSQVLATRKRCYPTGDTSTLSALRKLEQAQLVQDKTEQAHSTHKELVELARATPHLDALSASLKVFRPADFE